MLAVKNGKISQYVQGQWVKKESSMNNNIYGFEQFNS